MRLAVLTLLLALPLAAAAQPHAPHAPCAVPIDVHVGEVDGRFGFTRAQVERALGDAVAMWHAHARGPLFGPAPRRAMPVNLVYGARQRRAEDARSIRAQMDARSRVLDDRRAAHRRLEARIEAERLAYRRAADTLGPRSTESDRERVERMRVRLNASVAEFNELVGVLNREVGEYNTLAARYNQVAATTPEQAGQFSFTSRGGRRVDVFRAIDHEELVWVIAHELGHALGLDHVEDPRAVMAGTMGQERPRRLAPADIEALRRACS